MNLLVEVFPSRFNSDSNTGKSQSRHLTRSEGLERDEANGGCLRETSDCWRKEFHKFTLTAKAENEQLGEACRLFDRYCVGRWIG